MTQPYPSDQTGPEGGGGATSSSRRALDGLRRADALVLGGALLVLVFSFLPQLHVSVGGFGSASRSMWRAVGLSELFPVVLLTLVVAALAALPLVRPADKDAPLLVATASQWAAVLSIVPVVTSVFALFFWHEAGGIGYGAYLVVLATLLVLAGTLGATLLPALTEPLQPARPPAAPDAAAGSVGGAYAPPAAGWGQPPVAPASEPEPQAPGMPTTYAVSSPPAAEPVGAPDAPAETAALPQPVEPQPFEPVAPFEPQPVEPAAPFEAVAPQPVAPEPVADLTTPAPLFAQPEPVVPPPGVAQPFWACFPTVRPLLDGTTGTPVGQVTPDEWYLVTALDGRGATVQTTDGRIGLLTDVTGMVRAEG